LEHEPSGLLTQELLMQLLLLFQQSLARARAPQLTCLKHGCTTWDFFKIAWDRLEYCNLSNPKNRNSSG
jgi:hypothetical protein